MDNTVNSEIFARVLFSRNFASFVDINPHEIANSVYCLMIHVKHALVANFERHKCVF